MMGYGRGYGYGYNNMMGSGAAWFGVLLVFLFAAVVLTLIALLIIWAIQSSRKHGEGDGGPRMYSGVTGHEEAIAIAKRRLASGEITCEQYQEIMKALGA